MRALLVIAVLASAALADVPKAYTAYPGSRQLCNQHVSGNTMHIAWSTHATTDSLAKVLAHYESKLGKKAKAEDHGAKRLEVDADRHVTIYPAASEGKLPHCATKPKAGEQTIVMLSTATR